MWKRAVLAANLAIAAVLMWSVLAQTASGVTVGHLDIAAPAFVDRLATEHNDGDSTVPDACAAQVASTGGEENRGDLNNTTGSFIAPVELPDGATITAFTLLANDGDADFNSAAYLIKRHVVNGLTPASNGYVTAAQAQTSGAVPVTIRAFNAAKISAPVVDNARNAYYVELVNCAGTIEPYSVKVTFTVP